MVFSKNYIFLAVLVFIVLMLIAAMPLGGTTLAEALACIAAIGAAGWLGWRLFIERRMFLVQVASLRNDYKNQCEKASQSINDAKDLRHIRRGLRAERINP